MINSIFSVCTVCILFFTIPGMASNIAGPDPLKPNIVFIMADDLGYGEISALNVNPDRGIIETPHIDRLASEGMIFTDMHSESSICNPDTIRTAPIDAEAIEEGLPGIQLYNMKTDIRERENVYAEHAYVVRKLLRMLRKTVESGRSTRGIDLKNDIEDINIWKGKSFVVIEK